MSTPRPTLTSVTTGLTTSAGRRALDRRLSDHVQRLGEEHPPISCSRQCEPEMKVQTQTEELRRLRRTNLELIFSDHNAYCLPPCQNKCPSHIDIPGFLKANAETNWRESTRIFKRTIPFPSVLGRADSAPRTAPGRRDRGRWGTGSCA